MKSFALHGDRHSLDASGEIDLAGGWVVLRAWNDGADPRGVGPVSLRDYQSGVARRSRAGAECARRRGLVRPLADRVIEAVSPRDDYNTPTEKRMTLDYLSRARDAYQALAAGAPASSIDRSSPMKRIPTLGLLALLAAGTAVAQAPQTSLRCRRPESPGRCQRTATVAGRRVRRVQREEHQLRARPAAVGSVARALGRPDRTQLTHTPDSDEWLPQWSPDGRSIAFLSDRKGDAESTATRSPRRSGSCRPMAARRARSPTCPAAWRTTRWSPDGKQLAVIARDPDRAPGEAKPKNPPPIVTDRYPVQGGLQRLSRPSPQAPVRRRCRQRQGHAAHARRA